MPRRPSLPGADLLFGASPDFRKRDDGTGQAPPPELPKGPNANPPAPDDPQAGSRAALPAKDPVGKAVRPRHDEKITVYCTDSELTRLEAARLSLRANYRLPSDRGRIVRAAIAEILEDFDARGADSALVKRLSEQ